MQRELGVGAKAGALLLLCRWIVIHQRDNLLQKSLFGPFTSPRFVNSGLWRHFFIVRVTFRPRFLVQSFGFGM